MAIYIIGDLHLSFSTDKPMDVFGEHWHEHYKKIKSDWDAKVNDEDTVILAGDSSWAMNLKEFEADMDFIMSLKGRKIFIKGNHDYWWSSLKKMKEKYPEADFLHNNSFVVENKVIVGTRGWDYFFDQEDDSTDNKIYFRECSRLENSIATAPKDLEKICVMHYPPIRQGRKTRMSEVIEKHGIKRVYFGHIHSNFDLITTGEVDGVNYTMISADYIDFKLHRIED